MWRSLVARVVRDDEVAGSNPVTPTIGEAPSTGRGLRRLVAQVRARLGPQSRAPPAARSRARSEPPGPRRARRHQPRGPRRRRRGSRSPVPTPWPSAPPPCRPRLRERASARRRGQRRDAVTRSTLAAHATHERGAIECLERLVLDVDAEGPARATTATSRVRPLCEMLTSTLGSPAWAGLRRGRGRRESRPLTAEARRHEVADPVAAGRTGATQLLGQRGRVARRRRDPIGREGVEADRHAHSPVHARLRVASSTADAAGGTAARSRRAEPFGDAVRRASGSSGGPRRWSDRPRARTRPRCRRRA